MVNLEITNQSVRKACVVAGISLLVMGVLAGLAFFGAIQTLVAEGDAAKTAGNILDSENTFRFGIVGLVVVALLDVIVAWALFVIFSPVNKEISRLAAWFRAIYAGVFIVAISQLNDVLHFLQDTTTGNAFTTEQLQEQALLQIGFFENIWMFGLILFSFHLLLLGWLVFKADYAPKLLGVLLVIAGLGYLIDGFGTLLFVNYSLNLAAYTFIGEVVLIFWLLIKGRNITVHKEQAA